VVAAVGEQGVRDTAPEVEAQRQLVNLQLAAAGVR
jgi:hypothetical protein